MEIFSDPLPCFPTVLLSPHNRCYWDLHEGAGGHTYRRTQGSWGGGREGCGPKSPGAQEPGRTGGLSLDGDTAVSSGGENATPCDVEKGFTAPRG